MVEIIGKEFLKNHKRFFFKWNILNINFKSITSASKFTFTCKFIIYTHTCKTCFPLLFLNCVFLFHAKIITINATLFPTSIANSLIAVGTDGLQERDRMVRAAIAIICELGKCLTTTQQLNVQYMILIFKVTCSDRNSNFCRKVEPELYWKIRTEQNKYIHKVHQK